MEYKVKTTKTFEKEIKRLGKHYASIADDYAQLLNDLYANRSSEQTSEGACARFACA